MPQEGVKDSAENHGELLMGDRIENSLYRFKMYTNETDIFFCKIDPLPKDNFELLKRGIDEMYRGFFFLQSKKLFELLFHIVFSSVMNYF